MAPEPHIPAWKRLGLKLKYAKEDPPEPKEAPITTNGKKRKMEDDDSSERGSRSDPAKKPKTISASATNGESRKHGNGVNGIDTTKSQDDRSGPRDAVDKSRRVAESGTMQRLEKRKSVTFAPETKHANGENIKDLYQAWVTAQEGSNGNGNTTGQKEVTRDGGHLEDFGPEDRVGTATMKGKAKGKQKDARIEPSSKQMNIGDASCEPEPSITKKKKKKKGKKKSKTTLLSSPSKTDPNLSTSSSMSIPSTTSPSEPESPNKPSGPSPSAAALNYLNTFITSPSTWKFSKNHQTYLLKHILSLSKIPSEYDSALLSYLKGLRSRGAKSELRKRAKEARDADKSWMESRAEGSGGDGEEEKDEEKNGKDAQPQRQDERRKIFEQKWRRGLETILEHDTGDGSPNPALSSSEDNSSNNNRANTNAQQQQQQQQQEDKDLTWRIERRIRAEVILVAIGDEASPSPSPNPQTMMSTTSAPRMRNGVKKKQHIKFDNADDAGSIDEVNGRRAPPSSEKKLMDGVGGDRQKPAASSESQLAADRSQMMGKVVNGGTVAINGKDAQQVPEEEKKKKKKRKRRSRARTAAAAFSSDDSSSSSSDSSSSSSSDSE